MLAPQRSPWQSPWGELGAQNNSGLLRVLDVGAGYLRLQRDFPPSCSSPISWLYLGLDVIQRKGNRDRSKEGPESSPTSAWTR